MIKRTFLTLFIFLIILGCTDKKSAFVCVPCDLSCDLKIFSSGGSCAACGMKLAEKGTYNKELTTSQISEDFDILLTTLKSNHPGLYDYQNQSDFERKTKLLRTEIESAKNVLDEYRILSKLIAMVGDAHTYVMNPYYQNILQEELLFPIVPRIDNNQIRINGQNLRSINGYSSKELLTRLQSFSNSDGNTIPYKNAFIEMEFPLKYFTFVDTASTFDVTFENGKSKTVRGKSYFNKGLRPKIQSESLIINENTAIIKIPSWEDESASSFNSDLQEMIEKSKLAKFLSNSMEKIINAEVDKLTIDLRGNKGGKSGPAAVLLSYLIDKRFKYYTEIRVASDSFPTKQYISNKELVQFYESNDAKKLINKINGNYYFIDDLLPSIQPSLKQYLGAIEILVDKYTLSVSTDVVAILKKNRKVKVTGNEIGGSLDHYCAGNYLNLQLPNSKIEVNIPLQRLSY
ncbi:S41 family peptidase [Aquimarina sp. D1M17]|uniref:S41 family peptidase n=1 Tax=Aquimarina acroporae TaxID=2937283 RepID=UPI0020BF351E|nr:S41 family peptidase [Aquimarina acroporae]MCK8522220.1 S41 family peptidase [Aquimarina acroporae]